MDDEAFHQVLRAKRHELDKWFAMIRADYERQRDALDVLLGDDRHIVGPEVDEDVLDDEDGDDQPTTREFIRKALAAGRPMRMSNVVASVEEMGSKASPDTIRGVLQKMQHTNEVERIGRGMYRLISDLERADDGAADTYRRADSPDQFEYEADDPNPAYRGAAPSREGTSDTTN